MADYDNEELIQIFIEEAAELLKSIAVTLQHWEKDLTNKQYFSDLKRDLHTLKGGARMLNQSALSALAHELEALCEALLSDKIVADKDAYALVCAGQKRMMAFIDALRQKVDPPNLDELVKQCKQKISDSFMEEHTNLAQKPATTGIGVAPSASNTKSTKKSIQRVRKEIPIVLVVDDSVTIRTVTKNFLERHAFSVITASDGLEALERVHQKIPDIILLDMEMPRMNGFQFAENIRNIAKFSNIPIIMITFRAGDEEKQQAKKLGINKFMCKPYLESDLLEEINLLLPE